MYYLSRNTARSIRFISFLVLLLGALVWTVTRTAGYLGAEGIPAPWLVAVLVEFLTIALFIIGRQGNRIAKILSWCFILYAGWNIAGLNIIEISNRYSSYERDNTVISLLETKVSILSEAQSKAEKDKLNNLAEIDRIKSEQLKTKVGTYPYNLLRNDLNREKKALIASQGNLDVAGNRLRDARDKLDTLNKDSEPAGAFAVSLLHEVSRMILSLLIFFSALLLSHSLVKMFGIASEPHSNKQAKPRLVPSTAQASSAGAVVNEYRTRLGKRKTHHQTKT